MTLAELIIRLSADSASLKIDFDKATKIAKQASDDIASVIAPLKTIFAGVTAGFSLAAVSDELKNLVTDTASVGEQIYKMENITGLGAEALSGLRVEATESGESFESLSGTLSRLGKNIETAFTNPKSEPGKVLEALFGKADLESLKLEPVQKRIEDVTKKIFGLTDAQERDFAASTLVGRGWTENAEALRKLADDGFAGAENKARALGLLMGEDDVQAGHKLTEVLEDVKLMMIGVGEGIAEVLIPNLTAVLSPVNEAQAKLDNLKKYGFEPAQNLPGAAPTPDDMLSALPIWARQLSVQKAPSPLDALMHPAKTKTAKAGQPDAWQDIENDLPEDIDTQTQKSMATYMDTVRNFAREMNAALDPLSEYIKQTGQLHEAFDAGLVSADDYEHVMDKIWGDFKNKPDEDYDKAIARLNEDLKQGVIDGGEYAEMRAELNKIEMQRAPAELPLGQSGPTHQQLNELAPQGAADKFKTLDANAKQLGQDMSSAFTQMIVYGKNFEQEIKGMITLFAEFILKTYAFKEIASALGGSSSGGVAGLFSSFFSGLVGGKAAGGPVTAGDLYMVGEQGPELFAPGASGQIIPNDALTGGGNQTTNYIDARGAQPGVEHQIVRAIQAIQKQISAQSLASTYEYHMRGGSL